MEDQRVVTKVLAYPNPVTSTLFLSSLEGVEKLEVYSLSGVLKKSFKTISNQIDMSDLSAGTYLVLIHTRQEVFKQIIVKK